jgi:hypothetical protein
MPISDLKSLVPAKFGNLSDAEQLLLEKVPSGDPAICGSNFDDAESSPPHTYNGRHMS